MPTNFMSILQEDILWIHSTLLKNILHHLAEKCFISVMIVGWWNKERKIHGLYNGEILSYRTKAGWQRNIYCAVREQSMCTAYAELANKQRRENTGLRDLLETQGSRIFNLCRGWILCSLMKVGEECCLLMETSHGQSWQTEYGSSVARSNYSHRTRFCKAQENFGKQLYLNKWKILSFQTLQKHNWVCGVLGAKGLSEGT